MASRAGVGVAVAVNNDDSSRVVHHTLTRLSVHLWIQRELSASVCRTGDRLKELCVMMSFRPKRLSASMLDRNTSMAFQIILLTCFLPVF